MLNTHHKTLWGYGIKIKILLHVGIWLHRCSQLQHRQGRFQVVYGLPIQIRSSITIPPEKTLMQGIAKTAHNKVSGAPASAFLIIVRFTTAHTM
jgi:hypothetical protein